MLITEVDDAQESTDTQSSEETDETTEGQDQGQSSEGETSTEPKLFEYRGEKLTPEQIYEKYLALEKDYTRKSKKLAELEKTFKEGATTEKVSSDVAARYGLTPEVQAALQEVVTPLVRKEIQAATQASMQQAELDNAFKELASKWDGSDGKPKYDPKEKEIILDEMASGGKIFDPVVLWERKHQDEILDYYTKQALKKHGGALSTERTGGGTAKKPSTKPPKTIAEASKRALARLQSGESFE